MVAQIEGEVPFASLEPDTVIVVYDPKTGAVRHVHQEVTLPGGTSPTPENQIERAIAFAREHPGRAKAKLVAMRIAPNAFREFRREAFAIDVKRRIPVKRKDASGTPRRKTPLKKTTSTASSRTQKRPKRRS
jgi:hypothetical protein